MHIPLEHRVLLPKPSRALPNKDVHAAVARREVFRNRNNTLYAIVRGHGSPEERYIVYSYGAHFPLYIYDCLSATWFANSDRYSRTTSIHASEAYPPRVDHMADTHTMLSIANHGLTGAVLSAAQTPEPVAAFYVDLETYDKRTAAWLAARK